MKIPDFNKEENQIRNDKARPLVDKKKKLDCKKTIFAKSSSPLLHW
jgi:hypothetical protein